MEKVLCIAKKDIPAEWLKEMGKTGLSPAEFYGRMNCVDMYWLNRKDAEKNFSFKQIIPYVLFLNEKENLMACYRRSGSEKRLDDLWSVGIGGHINPVDSDGGNPSLPYLVEQGLLREIEEETGRPAHDLKLDFIGVINEEKTEVGLVHFGLVHWVNIEKTDRMRPAVELSRFQWIKFSSVKGLKLEHWSRLAIDLLAEWKFTCST